MMCRVDPQATGSRVTQGAEPGQVGSMPPPLVPDGRPLTGHWLRLHLLGEDDLGDLYPVLADPRDLQTGTSCRRPDQPMTRPSWPAGPFCQPERS